MVCKCIMGDTVLFDILCIVCPAPPHDNKCIYMHVLIKAMVADIMNIIPITCTFDDLH